MNWTRKEKMLITRSRKKQKLLTFFISLLILVLAAAYWFGVYHPRIRYLILALFSLGGLIWIISLARSGRALKLPTFCIPLGMLVGYQAILILKSPLPESALEASLSAIFYSLTFLFFLYSLQSSWDVDTWEKALIASVILYSIPDLISILLWLVNWWTVSGPLWSWPPFSFRISGSLFTSANTMAAYINLIFPMIVIHFVQAKRTSRRLLWAIILALILIIEFFASSRGSWISAIAGIGSTLAFLHLEHFHNFTSQIKLRRLFFSGRNALRLIAFLLIAGLIGFVFTRQVQLTPGHGPGGSGRMQIWTNSFNVFLRSPLLGNGPSSMQIYYAIESGNPPGFAADHAHNIFLQIAGEYGMVGLVMVVYSAGFIARTFIRTWRQANKNQKSVLAAIAGALIASGVHQLVDYFFEVPPYVIVVIILLAMLSYYSPDREKLRVGTKLSILIILSLLILFIVGTLYAVRGMVSFQKGVDTAFNNNWITSRNLICNSKNANPQQSYYAFQCAVSNAQVAHLFDDEKALEDALSAQMDGVKIDPYWPVSWANLAALEWATGEHLQALTHMQQAFTSAPRNWVFALNLGWMEEQLGREEDAHSHYKSALTLNPMLETTFFFIGSEVRLQATQEYEPFKNPSSSDQFALEGLRQINEGNLSDAKEMLNHALEINSHNGKAYAWLAQLQRIQGQIEEAWDTIQLGLFVESTSPTVLIIASEIEQDMGDEKNSQIHLYQAYKLFQMTHQSRRYYGGVYMRGLLPRDLVPQIILPELNSSSLDAFTELLVHPEIFTNQAEAYEFQKWLEDERGH